jgi:hypothetical protein
MTILRNITLLIISGIIIASGYEYKEEEIIEKTPEKVEPIIVFDGLTMEELIKKLNRNLNSTLSDKGEIFATKSIELGIDPYLAVAISLHETGCKWNCSALVKKCNNIGGMKGKPSCGTNGYRKFNTLEEGIIRYLESIKRNYYDYGLTTPEAMSRKYTGYSNSPWAGKVNSYIKQIREN